MGSLIDSQRKIFRINPRGLGFFVIGVSDEETQDAI
jgi:hypothetical protein